MNQLVESLKKYGQTYEIHRCKFGILDGYKRQEALVDIAKSRIIDHPDIKTVEEYNDWIQAHLPPKLSPKEKQTYAVKRAREYTAVGLTSGQYIPILAKLLQCTEHQIRKYLPTELKRDYSEKSQDQIGQKSNSPLIPQPPEKYRFVDGPLWAYLYRKLGSKKLLEALDDIDRHYVGLKSKPTITASVEELFEVLYARLEKANFPKLSEDNARWLRFLSEKYLEGKKDES
ncbi:hypothetical protein MUO83_03670 [Candidatus Bathyarchaeota archaeon]|nr:hypothetical protein [Candidatus Bathyarchaeota archaeon]